jgi:hypothetical protein
MQKSFLTIVAALALTVVSAVRADIYTCKHADGTTEYTNVPCGKGANTASVMRDAFSNRATQSSDGSKKVQNSGYSANSGPKTALAARVEPNVQRNRDDVRRTVLSKELEEEEKNLANVRGQYNGGTPALQPGESQASPKYLDRRAQLFQTVSLHEKNAAAIRQELSNIR